MRIDRGEKPRTVELRLGEWQMTMRRNQDGGVGAWAKEGQKQPNLDFLELVAKQS